MTATVRPRHDGVPVRTKATPSKCTLTRVCCSAWGKTETEAAREAQDAITAWLQAAKVAKRTIPKASVAAPVSGYSGKFLVRVPRSLHARLAREAEQQGVSLNQWTASKLAQHG